MPTYSDLSLNYTPSISPKTIVTDAESVVQSVVFLLTVEIGTIPWGRDRGANLDEIEMLPATEDTTILIRERMIRAIENNEKRVSVDRANTRISFNPQDNLYQCYLSYKIKGLPNKRLFEFTLPSSESL